MFQNWLDRNKVTPQVDEPKTLFRILIEKTSGKASYAELRKILGGLAPNRRGVKLPRKELLIHERAVHLDSLAERLKDARVRKVIQCILVGAMDPTNPEAPAITGVGA